jgi:hypothetical protein
MKPLLARMSIEYQAWNDESSCAGIEVPPSAAPEQIFTELQKKFEELLDDSSLFQICDRDPQTRAPWGIMRYRIVRKEEIAQRSTLHARGCAMSLAVPKFRPIEWERLAREVASPDVFVVQQTGQFEFTAIYDDEAMVFKVPFSVADRGDEHLARLYPRWENQKAGIAGVFGREMIPDDSKPTEVERYMSNRQMDLSLTRRSTEC